MWDHPCCRINRGKMHYEDTKGTENKMSDHPCCRINRGKTHYEDTKGAGEKCRIIRVVGLTVIKWVVKIQKGPVKQKYMAY